MSPQVPLAGVIGWPIGHSASPVVHGHWLQRYGLRGAYVPLEVAAADLAGVIEMLPRAGFVGANVTIPHKEAALALATEATARAHRIGAANTLHFRDGAVSADCTDGIGFVENLRDRCPAWDPAAGPVGLYGAGGAARAVLDALVQAGAPEIRITNRTRARAEALADAAPDRARVVDWAEAGKAAQDALLVVNTTSLGMVGQPAFDLRLPRLPQGALATDIVYTPLETPFLHAAALAGARTVDGLGMLLHQAVPGFEAWFGVRPEVDPELRSVVLQR